MNQQQNVTANEDIQKTAQKYIAAYAEKMRQQCANLYRDDLENKKHQAYLEKGRVCDDYNVFPLIIRDFESEEDLPPLEVLIAIGKLNLEELLRKQRRYFNQFKAAQTDLKRFLNHINEIDAEIKQHDNKAASPTLCPYDFPHQGGLFDYCEHCPLYHTFVTTSLDFFDKVHDGPPWPEETRQQYDAEMSKVNPHGKPCFVYQNNCYSKQLKQQFAQNIQDRYDYMGQQKHITLKYIRRIIAAKHDKRLRVLPLFAYFRTEKYLQFKEIFLMFRQDNLKLGDKNFYEHGFRIYQLVPKSRYFPNLVAIDESDNLYNCDDEKIYTKFASIVTSSQVVNLVRPNEIEQNLPIVIKPWEVLMLHNNPEYAKMWTYSNFREGCAEPFLMQLFLTAIQSLKPFGAVIKLEETQ